MEKRDPVPDGFVSSAGHPVLGAKYGNAVPSSPVTAKPAPEPAPVPPEALACLDTLTQLTGHLETVGVTPVCACAHVHSGG